MDLLPTLMLFQNKIEVKGVLPSEAMPRPGDAVHIPLPTDEAIRLALRVKPTAEMPRPGKHTTGPKKKRAKKKAKR